MLGRLRIPATVQPLAVDRRLARRSQLMASNGSAGRDIAVVTDTSTTGARLITPAPMQVGQEVLLILPLIEPQQGSLVWVSNRLAGCEFTDSLHPALLRVLLSAAKADPDEWQRSLAVRRPTK
jgi:hypothetical protein